MRGTPMFPMNEPAWKRPFENLIVSTRKMPVPTPVAPQEANACVEGPPNVSHPESVLATSV